MTGITARSRSGLAVRPRQVILAAFLLAGAVVLSWQALANMNQPTRGVVWASLALATYAAGLLCLVGGGEKWLGLSRWWFGSWILAWYGVAFGLASLTWVQPQIGTSAEIATSSVIRALWLVAVGMTLWVVGYLMGPGQPTKRLGIKAMAALSARFAPEVRSPLTPWVLFAIGTAASIVGAITTGQFGYVGDVQSTITTASGYQQWLDLLSLCGPLAVAAAALQVHRERVPGARATLIVLFVAEIAFGAAAGNKENFVITILAAAIPFTATRRKINVGLLAFAALTFLLIIVPFTQAYRSTARNASGTLPIGQAVEAIPGILKETIETGNFGGIISSSTSILLSRIREIDGPAIIVQRTPTQIGFLSPVQLVEAPVIDLVPRALWPGKPILDSGYEFSQEYYELPSTVYTSSAITPVGDLYRHGGWIPVIVGMYFLGWGTRLLDDALDVAGDPHSMFLFLLLFPILVKQEDDWAGTLTGIPGTMVIWLLAVYLAFRKRPRPHRARPKLE